MDSRRSVLKKLLVGTATAAAVPGVASATVQAVEANATGVASLVLQNGPSPWWLLNPVGLGTPLKYGWYISGLSEVSKGAAVLTLAHTNGRKAKLHLCAHHGKPQGLTHTALLDLVLMDGGSGSFRTDEKLGRVILGLAELMRRNEARPDGDLTPVARMLTHTDRVERFGADALV